MKVQAADMRLVLASNSCRPAAQAEHVIQGMTSVVCWWAHETKHHSELVLLSHWRSMPRGPNWTEMACNIACSLWTCAAEAWYVWCGCVRAALASASWCLKPSARVTHTWAAGQLCLGC